MAELKTTLKGFTLIETIVAMVIVLLSFSIATGIFINVRNSQNSTLRLKALMAMETLAQQTGKTGDFLNDEYAYEEFRIEKTCTPYAAGSDAILVVFECYQPGNKKIGERKEIMLPTNPLTGTE